jgi:S1-C subfamily serine protease
MSSRARRLVLTVLGLTIFTNIGLQAGNPPPNDAPPSLDTLKTVDYTPSANAEQDDVIGYSALRVLIDACQTYVRGLGVLPNFHEPVLTRGDVGISVFRKVSPSVVLVLTANFKDDKVTDSGLGTGVIVDPAGYVLTNWHVVAGYDAAIVFFKPVVGTDLDKNTSYGVKLVGLDKTADLALLKIIKPPTGLAAVKLGELSTIQVAEDIHIIGHPHGNLWSYSTGVISQVRDQYGWKYTDGSEHLARVLQMQTAINPGNSGGPVLDNNANMLGLVAMSEEGQNLNYAVAIDTIRNFVNTSLANKTRGAETHTQTAEGKIYTGQTKGGFSVTKSEYSNFVSYSVRDSKGSPIELLAETTDGAILRGSNPNHFGGFTEWTYTPSHGKPIFVRSSGDAPDFISAVKIDQ